MSRSALVTLDDELTVEQRRYGEVVSGGHHTLRAQDPDTGVTRIFEFTIDGEAHSLGCWDLPTDAPCAPVAP